MALLRTRDEAIAWVRVLDSGLTAPEFVGKAESAGVGDRQQHLHKRQRGSWLELTVCLSVTQ